MEAADLRREFPVLARVAYLNAGTNGPVPAAGFRAAVERGRAELEAGRADLAYWDALTGLGDRIRERLAELLRCDPGDVALTHSTTEGVNIVLSSLDLGRGDEVLTTDEEHPGLLAPLAAAARRRGVSVRAVPFAAIGGEVGQSTRLVACSHVSWVTGSVADTRALAAASVPVLLDGAQGIGAVPAEVGALGCDFYSASGQKWLCGPSGTGCLWVHPERCRDLVPSFVGYESLSDPERASELPLHPGARRFDRGPGSGPTWAGWLAGIDLLAACGWPAVHARARELAELLASRLTERGTEVMPRGPSTLVSWRDADAAATVEKLAAAGIVVRDLPGRGLVRASVGAWSSEGELERLVELVG